MNQAPINPAADFLRTPYPGTAEEIIRGFALFLLQAASIYCLPVTLETIKAQYSLAVHRRPISTDQRGFTTEDLRIYLNADDLPTVQNFTFAHELMELLFIALDEGVADEWMDDTTYTTLRESKEQLCEMGAAELLMPSSLFAELVAQKPLSFDWARQVAGRCGVSLTATLWRMLDAGFANALFIIWKYKHSRRQFVPSKVGQANLFGPPEAMDPPKKMRVERVFLPPGFGKFIPKEKSVPMNGTIHRAYLSNEAAEGWDNIDLATLKGRFFVEAMPFSADGERRVMSLIHLSRQPRA